MAENPGNSAETLRLEHALKQLVNSYGLETVQSMLHKLTPTDEQSKSEPTLPSTGLKELLTSQGMPAYSMQIHIHAGHQLFGKSYDSHKGYTDFDFKNDEMKAIFEPERRSAQFMGQLAFIQAENKGFRHQQDQLRIALVDHPRGNSSGKSFLAFQYYKSEMDNAGRLGRDLIVLLLPEQLARETLNRIRDMQPNQALTEIQSAIDSNLPRVSPPFQFKETVVITGDDIEGKKAGDIKSLKVEKIPAP